MKKIIHRVNTLELLRKIEDLRYGVEIDLRYHEDKLIIHHDPFIFKDVLLFEDFLTAYNLLGPLIINLKTEGIEERVIHYLNKYALKEWFFLDMSMPYFIHYTKYAANHHIKNFTINNLAVRFSEYEAIEYALGFIGKCGWVWVDCFNTFPLNVSNYALLKQANFKICLVSPELQGHSSSHIANIKDQIKEMEIDAICTKYPLLW